MTNTSTPLKSTASCVCGDVRLVAIGAPNRVGVCHCFECRKHHGALFHASAVFAQAQVQITGQVAEYEGRFFCPRCGSSVYSRSGDEIEVHLGALDDINRFKPDYELWTKRRENWLPTFEGFEQFDEDRD
ncbi:MAG: GFA family protein [Pseudomonadota bacterium]